MQYPEKRTGMYCHPDLPDARVAAVANPVSRDRDDFNCYLGRLCCYLPSHESVYSVLVYSD